MVCNNRKLFQFSRIGAMLFFIPTSETYIKDRDPPRTSGNLADYSPKNFAKNTCPLSAAQIFPQNWI